jgi:hypothetical protein
VPRLQGRPKQPGVSLIGVNPPEGKLRAGSIPARGPTHDQHVLSLNSCHCKLSPDQPRALAMHSARPSGALRTLDAMDRLGSR